MAVGALYPIAGTLLSPMLAAAAMAFSSVFVLGQRDAAEEARARLRTPKLSGSAIKPLLAAE